MNDKILKKVLFAKNDNNIKFKDLIKLLNQLGFEYRIKGDHHIFYKNDVDEIINIQPNKNMAKAYQVKQIRNIIIKYKMEV